MNNQILLLIPEIVINSKIYSSLRDILPNHTLINITTDCVRYKEEFNKHDHVITWNCRMPHWWFEHHTSKNILYIENSLLNQRKGIFLDSEGFFSHSHLAKTPINTTIDDDDICRIQSNIETILERNLLQHTPVHDDVLLILQNNDDSNIQYQFPLAKNHLNKIKFTLEIMNDFCANQSVDIRPHPRFLNKWNDYMRDDDFKKLIRSNWNIDVSKDVFSKLNQYKQIVGINSTLLSELLCFGCPISSLGTGYFTKHGVVNDCSKNLSNLLTEFHPDKYQIYKYINEIVSHNMLLYTATANEILNNKHFTTWLTNII